MLAGGGEVVESPFVADLLLYRPRLDPASARHQHDRQRRRGRLRRLALGARVGRAARRRLRKHPPLPVPRGARTRAGPGCRRRHRELGRRRRAERCPRARCPSRTAVSASLLSAEELAGLPAVAGFDTLAAVRIDLGGHTLARAATLSLDTPEGTPDAIPGDPRLVLAELVEDAADGRGSYPRLAARVSRVDGAVRPPAGRAGERRLRAAARRHRPRGPLPGALGADPDRLRHRLRPRPQRLRARGRRG